MAQYFPCGGGLSGGAPNSAEISLDVEVDTLAAGKRYPDGTDNKGVWYGRRTKANAFDNTSITLGQDSETLAGNAISIGHEAIADVVDGIAIGAGAQTGNISNAIVINTSGSQYSPIDSSHAVALSVNSSSLTPNSFGMTVNGGVRQIEAYNSYYETAVTAGGTTVLTSSSAHYYYFTGAMDQIVQLPDVTTLSLGFQFRIVNNSTGEITVNSSGGDLVTTVTTRNLSLVTCIALTGTTETSWSRTNMVLSVFDATENPPYPIEARPEYGTGSGDTFAGHPSAVFFGNNQGTNVGDRAVIFGHNNSAGGTFPRGATILGGSSRCTEGNCLGKNCANGDITFSVGNFNSVSGQRSGLIGGRATIPGGNGWSIGFMSSAKSGPCIGARSGQVLNNVTGSRTSAIGWNVQTQRNQNGANAIGVTNTSESSAVIGINSHILYRWKSVTSTNQSSNNNTNITSNNPQGYVNLNSTIGPNATATFTIFNNICLSDSLIQLSMRADTACVASLTFVSDGSFGVRIYNTEASSSTARTLYWDLYNGT